VGPSAGCTAVCAVVRGSELWVANAGDSRCLFSRNGTAVAMTTDHKPNDTEEYARIVKVRCFLSISTAGGLLLLLFGLGVNAPGLSAILPGAVGAVPNAGVEVGTLSGNPVCGMLLQSHAGKGPGFLHTTSVPGVLREMPWCQQSWPALTTLKILLSPAGCRQEALWQTAA
jgi:hypothetical protein